MNHIHTENRLNYTFFGDDIPAGVSTPSEIHDRVKKRKTPVIKMQEFDTTVTYCVTFSDGTQAEVTENCARWIYMRYATI